MQEVVTIVYGKNVKKKHISSIPFLKGINIWKKNQKGRTGEIVTRIKEYSKGNIVDGIHNRPEFYRKRKGVLFKEEKPSNNYYIMPKRSNEIVVFRITRVEDGCYWKISKDNEMQIEVVIKESKGW